MELDCVVGGEVIGGEAIGGEAIKKKTTKIKKIINTDNDKSKLEEGEDTINNKIKAKDEAKLKAKIKAKANYDAKPKCKCTKSIPIYNIEGETKGICCFKCKEPNMIIVKGKRCKCKKSIPAYSFKDKKAEYCAECMEDGMITTIKKKFCKCGKKQPTYNFPNKKPAICCKECMEDGMENISSVKCRCTKSQPCYNFENKKIPICCKDCKDPLMIDIVNKKKLCSCDKKVRATFNFEGEKLAICCFSCKKPDMVNVIDTKCLCKKSQPNFNFEGQKKPICCIKCKKEGMVDIRNQNKMCKCEKKARANFNIEGETNGICCINCKTDDMVDILHTKCIGIDGECPLKQRGNTKYNNYCTACFQQNFPNDPLTLNIRSKTKEIEVRDFINTKYEGFIHDKPIWTGNCDCTIRRRIDHRRLIDNTLLVVETDENQHKPYDKMDEEIRYDDLFMAFGGKWVYIRFNPDIYTNKKGLKVNPTIPERLRILEKELDKQINRIKKEKNKELLERIYLFYDGYDY